MPATWALSLIAIQTILYAGTTVVFVNWLMSTSFNWITLGLSIMYLGYTIGNVGVGIVTWAQGRALG